MVKNMKWAVALLCCLEMATGAELTASRTVFLMPLSHGLDQFVANRLIQMHVLRVVTDPAKADTIITDQVGRGFEARMKDLYPPPPEPSAEPPADAKVTQAAKPKPDNPPNRGDMPEQQQHGLASMLGDTVNKADQQGSMGVYGRGRGTLFLVDVQSRQVLWSIFEKPKSFSPQALDQTADKIVKRLKEDLNPKTK